MAASIDQLKVGFKVELEEMTEIKKALEETAATNKGLKRRYAELRKSIASFMTVNKFDKVEYSDDYDIKLKTTVKKPKITIEIVQRRAVEFGEIHNLDDEWPVLVSDMCTFVTDKQQEEASDEPSKKTLSIRKKAKKTKKEPSKSVDMRD